MVMLAEALLSMLYQKPLARSVENRRDSKSSKKSRTRQGSNRQLGLILFFRALSHRFLFESF
jgi:hypothetical protein